MKILFKLPSIMLLTGLMALQVSVVSAKSFSKVYHSSECSPYGAQLKSHQYSNSFKNNTSNYITVVCPIIRPEPPLFGGYYALQVRAHVGGGNGKTASCSLNLFDNSGTYKASDYDSSDFGSMYMYLKNSETQYTDGTYSLICYIPPGGYFYNYRVTEHS